MIAAADFPYGILPRPGQLTNELGSPKRLSPQLRKEFKLLVVVSVR